MSACLSLLLLAGVLAAPRGAAAELHVWVDEHGTTHISDAAAQSPGGSASLGDREAPALRELWGDQVLGAPVVPVPGSSGSEEDRTLRALRSAVEDLGRGESARAATALSAILRREPQRPEPHYYLALLEGQRGHLGAAEAHLRAFLEHAGTRHEAWRASARKRLSWIEDERRLMASPAAASLRLVDLQHPGFRIQADAELVRSGAAEFARRVARYLEDARQLVSGGLGVVPEEPTGVVLYSKGAYGRAFAQRFSFRTVGFYDGRIHVVSAAHPAGELRTLLVHEYTHALFRERTGGDRPFWLNEGLAELFERRSQGRPIQSRGERASLASALSAGEWISLRRLAPSFSGLDDRQAREAYRIATAAVELVQRRTRPAERARLLDLLGRGVAADEALRATLGLDTEGIDAALRAEIAGEFPAAL